jgi:hypothetical protein
VAEGDIDYEAQNNKSDCVEVLFLRILNNWSNDEENGHEDDKNRKDEWNLERNVEL